MASASATPSLVAATGTPTPTLQASPTPKRGGKGRVLRLSAVPNPQSGPRLQLAFEIEMGMDEIELTLYTKAMTRVAQFKLTGPYGAGWNRASVEWPAGLCSGLYYLRTAEAAPEKLLRLE